MGVDPSDDFLNDHGAAAGGDDVRDGGAGDGGPAAVIMMPFGELACGVVGVVNEGRPAGLQLPENLRDVGVEDDLGINQGIERENEVVGAVAASVMPSLLSKRACCVFSNLARQASTQDWFRSMPR